MGNGKSATPAYLDPTYSEKGSQLYYDFYGNKDHVEVAQAVRSMQNVRRLVSYDDVLPIQEMYSGAPALQCAIGKRGLEAAVRRLARSEDQRRLSSSRA